MKDVEYYWKRAKVCWIIAGVFAGIVVVLRILLLVMEALGYE